MTHRLHAQDAHAIVLAQRRCKLEVLNELIRMVERKVRSAATMGHSDVLFEIPPCLHDNGYVQIGDAVEKLKKHFSDVGFYTASMDRTIYLSWRFAATSSCK